MTRMPDDKPSALPRGKIEELCLLSAIPDEGCAVDELPNRLGLSPLLAGAVEKASVGLLNAGLIQALDGRVAVTAEGKAWVEDHQRG